MKIIDLGPKHYETYFHCLEEWSEDMKEAGNHKACWYKKYKDRGLRVKLAIDKKDQVGGMIQYLPIEESFVQGEELLFILCIWVHGHKNGMGNLQKKGLGKALLLAAEYDARKNGTQGLAAWGLWLPFWMKAAWFKKQGFQKADRDGMAELVWKPFTRKAKCPQWIKQKEKINATPGKLTVMAFKNGWCPVQNLLFERTKKAVSEYGNSVDFQVIDTTDPGTFLNYGITDGVFINGKRIGGGPPMTYNKIKNIIDKQYKKSILHH